MSARRLADSSRCRWRIRRSAQADAHRLVVARQPLERGNRRAGAVMLEDQLEPPTRVDAVVERDLDDGPQSIAVARALSVGPVVADRPGDRLVLADGAVIGPGRRDVAAGKVLRADQADRLDVLLLVLRPRRLGDVGQRAGRDQRQSQLVPRPQENRIEQRHGSLRPRRVRRPAAPGPLAALVRAASPRSIRTARIPADPTLPAGRRPRRPRSQHHASRSVLPRSRVAAGRHSRWLDGFAPPAHSPSDFSAGGVVGVESGGMASISARIECLLADQDRLR